MKDIKLLIFIIILFCIYDGRGQWTEISNLGDRKIETLVFLNDDLGYALMNEGTGHMPSLMKTTNGGADWEELNMPVETGEFQDIDFYEEGKGVLLIRDLSNDTVPTKLYRTTDDGMSWDNISPKTTARGVGVGQCQFLNSNYGFIATDRFLYITEDAGDNWIPLEFEDYILSLDFLDPDHGILGTWNGRFSYKGSMLMTSDGGANWKTFTLDEDYTSIVEVRQLTERVALAAPVFSWASIRAHNLYKTTDGGSTWNEIELPLPDEDYTLRQIDFKNENDGVICQGDFNLTIIYGTSDGGSTWTQEGTISSNDNTDLQLTPNSGYIGGNTGSFHKRTKSTSMRSILSETDIVLYPLPARAGQAIHLSAPRSFNKLSLIDPSGRTIYQRSIDEDMITLPLLDPGCYIISLTDGKVIASEQIIVE